MEYMECKTPKDVSLVEKKILAKMRMCAEETPHNTEEPNVSKCNFDNFDPGMFPLLCACCNPVMDLRSKLCLVTTRLELKPGQLRLFGVFNQEYDEDFLAYSFKTPEDTEIYKTIAWWFGELGFGTGADSKRFDSPLSLVQMNNIPNKTTTVAYKLVVDKRETENSWHNLKTFINGFDKNTEPIQLMTWFDSDSEHQQDFEDETNMQKWFLQTMKSYLVERFLGEPINRALINAMAQILQTVLCNSKNTSLITQASCNYLLRK
jgi:hypothetical protein